MKAKYGFSAPPTYCKTDKLEGMHEITIEEMNSLSKPVQPSLDAVIVNVPSTILDSNNAPVPEGESLFQFFLCIGVSTASVERLFSILNLVKKARRSRLGQSILNELSPFAKEQFVNFSL